jgi:hypothetical protein
MTPYRVFIHLELLDLLAPRSAHRAAILKFIRSLGDDPNRLGDYTDRDETDRIRQVKVIGPYAVTYWSDHPVKSVFVVSIDLADR